MTITRSLVVQVIQRDRRVTRPADQPEPLTGLDALARERGRKQKNP